MFKKKKKYPHGPVLIGSIRETQGLSGFEQVLQAAKVSSQNLQGPSVPEESGERPPGRHRAIGTGSSVSI